MAKKTIEQIEASIARWQSRLKRAVNAIDRLDKQRKRMLKPKPLAEILGPIENVGSVAPVPKNLQTLDKLDPPPPIDTGIPDFLKRGIAAQKAVNEIIAEQAETKKKKAAGRIAKMKAKKAGDLKRMPLTGKAALAAIDNG